MHLKWIHILRWVTRIFSGLLLILIAIFIIAEGLPNPMALTKHERLLFFAITIMEIGLILAFKWELYGGLITLAGYILFVIVDQNILPGPVFPLFFVIGILHLFCWWISRKPPAE